MSSSPDQPSISIATRLFRREQEKEDRKLRVSTTLFFKDVFRVRASVLPRVWPSVLGVTAWATAVATADLLYGRSWQTTSAVVAPLSIVVGLLIAFRNSSSIVDRWQAGLILWLNTMSDARNLIRYLWLNIDIDAPAPEGVKVRSREERLERKKAAIRMVLGFVVAAKHFLRSEPGIGHAELQDLLPEDLKVRWLVSINRSIEGRSPQQPSTYQEDSPLLEASVEEDKDDPALCLPLFILHELAVYVVGVRAAKLMEPAGPAGFSAINGLLNSLTNNLANLERIATIQLPTILSIHLKTVVLLYLFSLPLTLVGELSWRMVPFVTIVAFIFIGIEGISSEIEMPFGDDPSDHNLNLYTAQLRHEAEHMMAFFSQPPSYE
ncbi:unnamed protein product [Tilletia controversa]|uniref:Uncharacterized protein n=3 Tax=Tilletia TaxID=13289 RepID=A0A8X7MW99_9BASI|nr:hypothetical protein CF335_g5998 [Tilletia laevis]KAE8203449.1 hypothetical protein CF328_g1652 [Tilletia controversa]KAE8264683.1 hypothetical protein A4X03_0g776 [Tilletia caries]KAE8201711.1 hypothetical protein CF336_g33 [Tilletia laevis]KAE8249570.1 hypothetical protein A4X06_0g3167 [Tilletia controversa]